MTDTLLPVQNHSAWGRAVQLSGAALLLFAGAAHALPTGNPLPGPSGLGAIPTTQTAAPGVVEGTLIYERVNLDDIDGHVDILPIANLTYGLHKGEIGLSYVREDSDFDGFSIKESYYALHGKYRVYENPRGVQAAVGAHYYDFGSSEGFDLGNVISLYGTGSYDFRREDNRLLGRVHAGLLYQRINGGEGGDDDNLLRPFIGGEYFASQNLSIAADYLSSDGDAAKAYTLSVRYQPQGSRLGAQVGVGKLRSDTKLFAGISYAFGGNRGTSATTIAPASSPTATAEVAQ
jgi:hypothetical protein